MKKIVIISNVTSGLIRFRKELIEKISETYELTILASDTGGTDDLKKLKCKFINTELDRHGTNPMKELLLILLYMKHLKHIKPDYVLTYTIKPNVYGGITCQILNIPYIANVTGLGTAIQNLGLMQKISLLLYRFGLRKAQKVFFQNVENQRYMIEHKVVSSKYDLLPGSGINLNNYTFEKYPQNKNNDHLIFITVGRIMKDKGIVEVIEAARIIKEKYEDVIFKLIGPYDEDFREIVESAQKDGSVEYLGLLQDVKPFYKECNAVIHASYHEGMSNVLLEASATGRPVIATDIPGCREIFDNGVSGISFKPKDVNDLVRAIEEFIHLSHEQRSEMGKAAREKVEKQFSRDIVISKYLRELKGFGNNESL